MFLLTLSLFGPSGFFDIINYWNWKEYWNSWIKNVSHIVNHFHQSNLNQIHIWHELNLKYFMDHHLNQSWFRKMLNSSMVQRLSVWPCHQSQLNQETISLLLWKVFCLMLFITNWFVIFQNHRWRFSKSYWFGCQTFVKTLTSGGWLGHSSGIMMSHLSLA